MSLILYRVTYTRCSMSTVNVQPEILFSVPLEQVAAYVANPDNAPEWYVNIKSAEWKTPKPLVMGSQIAFVAHFLGRKLSYVYEIIEHIPNERMVMRTADGPFPMETPYTWKAAANNQTLMQLRNAGSPAGFSRLFAPFMAGAMRRANQKDLIRLKQLLEHA